MFYSKHNPSYCPALPTINSTVNNVMADIIIVLHTSTLHALLFNNQNCSQTYTTSSKQLLHHSSLLYTILHKSLVKTCSYCTSITHIWPTHVQLQLTTRGASQRPHRQHLQTTTTRACISHNQRNPQPAQQPHVSSNPHQSLPIRTPSNFRTPQPSKYSNQPTPHHPGPTPSNKWPIRQLYGRWCAAVTWHVGSFQLCDVAYESRRQG